MSRKPSPEPWRIHFFRRHGSDDKSESVPTKEFLDHIPAKCAAEIQAVLDAIAAAPPPAFSGGGKWQAMHGEMAGLYEVRVQCGGRNHRLLCILERDAADLGGSSVVCLGGFSKPPRSAARPQDYRTIRRYADEFARHRRVLT
jgi:hypothetical protein